MTVDLFDDRYGAGAHQTLLELLRQPCVTFADIADRFGVTRERVRQWHSALLPDAPKGHERQRLCSVHKQRRRLFQNALFRAFFQHARPHFAAGRIQPIRSGQSYRTRLVLIDTHVVALRNGTPRSGFDGNAAFVYFWLSDTEFLFVPRHAIAAKRITSLRALRPFRNSFAALTTAAMLHTPRPAVSPETNRSVELQG